MNIDWGMTERRGVMEGEYYTSILTELLLILHDWMKMQELNNSKWAKIIKMFNDL